MPSASGRDGERRRGGAIRLQPGAEREHLAGEAVGRAGWNPALNPAEQSIESLKYANWFKEVFLDSDTKVACISGSYSVDEKFSFLTNDMKRDAREKIKQLNALDSADLQAGQRLVVPAG